MALITKDEGGEDQRRGSRLLLLLPRPEIASHDRVMVLEARRGKADVKEAILASRITTIRAAGSTSLGRDRLGALNDKGVTTDCGDDSTRRAWLVSLSALRVVALNNLRVAATGSVAKSLDPCHACRHRNRLAEND